LACRKHRSGTFWISRKVALRNFTARHMGPPLGFTARHMGPPLGFTARHMGPPLGITTRNHHSAPSTLLLRHSIVILTF